MPLRKKQGNLSLQPPPPHCWQQGPCAMSCLNFLTGLLSRKHLRWSVKLIQRAKLDAFGTSVHTSVRVHITLVLRSHIHICSLFSDKGGTRTGPLFIDICFLGFYVFAHLFLLSDACLKYHSGVCILRSSHDKARASLYQR